MEQERARQAAALLVEAGNALFRFPGNATPQDQARARLILQALGQMRTAALAAGARDLAAGVSFLRAEATRAGVPVLSANLVGPDGKALFPASAVVEAGGVRVGLIGLSPEGPVAGAPGVAGRPPVEAALREARQLRGRTDLVVVLAAMPSEQARAVLEAAGTHVDFLVQSHEGRGAGRAQAFGPAWLIPSGERGRQLGVLTLSLGEGASLGKGSAQGRAPQGRGAFADLEAGARDRELLERVEANLRLTRERLADAQEERTRRGLREALASLEARREALARSVAKHGVEAGRTFSLRFLSLGPEVPADPALEARVRALEPPGGSAH